LFTCEEERLLARNVFWGYQYSEKVVAFGIAKPPEPAPEGASALLAKMPELEKRRFFLFLSRIHEKKGCDLLVGAFAKVASAHPDIDLVIAGPGDDGLKNQLKQLAEAKGVARRIHWPGPLTGSAKWEAFRSAEAFVLTSHQENFGIVLAEAMACSTPVLTTNKVNIWREIEASGGGFIEEDTEAGALRLLQRWQACSPEAKADMGENARRGFEENFQIEKAAIDLESALNAARLGIR